MNLPSVHSFIRMRADDVWANIVKGPGQFESSRFYRALKNSGLPFNKGFVAGGCVREFVQGNWNRGKMPDTDIDFWCKDTFELVPKQGKITSMRLAPYLANFEWNTFTGRTVKVQVIHKLWGGNTDWTPEGVMSHFDYTISMFAFDGEYIITTVKALNDLATKHLAVNTITYPVASMQRLVKYERKGFKPCRGTMHDLLRAVVPVEQGGLGVPIEETVIYVD